MANELFVLFIGVGWLLIGVGILYAGIAYHQRICTQKSTEYKKYITNMYIASKIRFLATKDGLDLTEEEKNFTEYKALSEKDRIESLDDKIENDLMEKVTNEAPTK